MRLEKVIAKNFLTYDELEYVIEDRPLSVQGRNLTDEGQASNGSGKSGIQTIIEFCITAQNSRGVRDNELVSYGYDKANAELVASCDIRKERIDIQWTIKFKGSNLLTITKQKYDGAWEEISFSNLNDGKKWILNWFDISKEDLFNYFLINKARFKSFFESSNKDKVDLINRFSDASIVEGLEDIDTDELTSQLATNQTTIIQTQTRIEVKLEEINVESSRNFEEELEEILEDIDDDITSKSDAIVQIKVNQKQKDKDLAQLNIDIANGQSDIKQDEKTLIEINKDIEDHLKVLSEVEVQLTDAELLVSSFKGLDRSQDRLDLSEEIVDSHEQVEDLEDQKDQLADNKEKVLKIIESINVKLSGSIQCPSCDHKFILDGDIEELEAKKINALSLSKKMIASMSLKDDSIKKLESQITTLQEQISAIKALETNSLEGKSDFIKAVQILQQSIAIHDTRTRILNKEKGIHQEDLETLHREVKKDQAKIIELQEDKDALSNKATQHQNDIADLKVKRQGCVIESNQKAISLLQKDVEQLELNKTALNDKAIIIGDQIYNKNQWKLIFKNFRLHLANQSLEVIEYHSNRYLSEMNSDLRIKLEGYKTLADGSIKDEITCKVVRGIERTFNSFSGGEKGRLLFASILANRHMINSTHKYGGLDFLSIDEVFEGVDGMGISSLVDSAKLLNIAVMIITHVTDDNATEDVLLIEKRGGISKVIKQ
tara:strand:- start:19097 stop:21250 length:2154 start_codon:yes stop_codon:yes gene_type:complete